MGRSFLLIHRCDVHLINSNHHNYTIWLVSSLQDYTFLARLSTFSIFWTVSKTIILSIWHKKIVRYQLLQKIGMIRMMIWYICKLVVLISKKILISPWIVMIYLPIRSLKTHNTMPRLVVLNFIAKWKRECLKISHHQINSHKKVLKSQDINLNKHNVWNQRVRKNKNSKVIILIKNPILNNQVKAERNHQGKFSKS